MDIGGNWPYPAEWGLPKAVPDRALIDDEAAARLLADWARMQIGKRQRSTRTTPAAARARLRLLEARARLLEVDAG
jgi:hypothetical protein